MKSTLFSIFSILFSLLYIIWWFSLFFIGSLRYEGFSIFEAAYGRFFAWVIFIAAILILLSIIYLRKIFKKKLFVYIIAYTMTIIFSITFILLGDAGTNKFSTFTSENWINYPMQRILMYPDLKKHYNIVGYSTNDIKTLLGEPEYIDSSYTYLYESGRYLIFIEFNNGKVVDMYYRN